MSLSVCMKHEQPKEGDPRRADRPAESSLAGEKDEVKE